MIKSNVRAAIEKALKTLGVDAKDFSLERSPRPEYGDYATNVALRTENPEESAPALAAEIARHPDIEQAEAVRGFLNITVQPDVWRKELGRVLKNRDNYGVLTLGKEKTVNVEFVSANPTGELHVGNGRGAFFGDALANVLEKAGYNVEREYYVNDAKVSLQIRELGKTALGKGDAYLTDYLKKIIAELSSKLEKAADESEAGYIVAQRILADIKLFVGESLGIRIDRWFSENDLFESGEINAVRDEIPSYEKDGALWAKTAELGDEEDRVLVRSDGTPGYFLSDAAYHVHKARRADIIVNVWGADHQGHVRRIYAIGKTLGFAAKLRILISQIVHILEKGAGKKISKREGTAIPLRWLVDEIGADSARFFYLSKSLSTHMDFDVSLAKEQSQKNPVWYVQYSYARSHQIFERAGLNSFDPKSADLSLLVEPAEMALMKKLAEYPEIIEIVAHGRQASVPGQYEYDIHKLTTYAGELSTAFHKFYEQSRVLVDDKPLRSSRLALVRAYQIVLKDCLGLLGISVPHKM